MFSHNEYLKKIENDGLIIKDAPDVLRADASKYLELCLAAVKQNGLALQYVQMEKIPEANKFDLYFAAVRQNLRAMEFVPPAKRTPQLFQATIDLLNTRDEENDLKTVMKDGLQLQQIPRTRCTYKVCLAAVEQNGLALEFIPKEHHKPELLLAAVHDNEMALKHVYWRSVPVNTVTELCLDAVDIDGLALEFVPWELIPDAKKFEVCETAVKSRGEALKHVPEIYSRLHPQEYKKICLGAIENDVDAFLYVHMNFQNVTLFLEALQKNGLVLKYTPEKFQPTAEHYLQAVKQNGLALEYVPAAFRTVALCQAAIEQNGLALRHVPPNMQSIALCQKAVEKNALALKFVKDDKLKENVIDLITPQKILSENYNVRHYFPKDQKHQDAIKKFLANVEHVVIFQSTADHEIRDASLVYANSPARKGKTVCTTTDDMANLLNDLREAQGDKSEKKLNLVLMGHATESRSQLSGLSVEKITNVLSDNNNISRVTLMGCSTAQSLKLEQEKEMIKSYADSLKVKTGIVYMYTSPDPSEYERIFRESAAKVKCTKVYIASPDPANPALCNMICLERKGSKLTTEQIPSLQIPVTDLKKRINKDRHITFESRDITPVLLDKDKIHALQEMVHPEHKKMYPFLRGMEISPEEAEAKLKDSLLKKVVGAIKTRSDITQSVVVKAYASPLHVDTHEKRFHVSRTHLYKPSYSASFFHAGESNIDTKKLKEDRKRLVSKMKSENIEGDTIVKAIKVRVSPKR